MGIKNVVGKAGLFLRKHSPEILGAVGVVATVGGVIWACKATMDSADDIRECQEEVAEVKQNIEEEIVEKKAGRKAIWNARLLCAKKVSVRFVGPVALVGGGLYCHYKAESILGGRVNSLAAACTAWEARYKLLEDNVRRDYGEEELQRLKYGLRSQKGTVRRQDDVGNEMDREETVTGVVDLDNLRKFTIIFDNRSPYHHTSKRHCEAEFDAFEKNMTELLTSGKKNTIWLDWAMERIGVKPRNRKEALLWHSICWTYRPDDPNHDNCVKLRWKQVIDPDDSQFDIDYNPVYTFDPNYDTNINQDFYRPEE